MAWIVRDKTTTDQGKQSISHWESQRCEGAGTIDIILISSSSNRCGSPSQENAWDNRIEGEDKKYYRHVFPVEDKQMETCTTILTFRGEERDEKNRAKFLCLPVWLTQFRTFSRRTFNWIQTKFPEMSDVSWKSPRKASTWGINNFVHWNSKFFRFFFFMDFNLFNHFEAIRRKSLCP